MSLSERLSRKKTPVTTNYLDLTPQALLEYEIAPTGLVILHVPRFTSKFWGRFFQTGVGHKPIKLNLDEFGSATWLLIDGQHNVHTIINILEEQFGERIKPADDRVTRFLSSLYRDKFIGFIEII